MDFVTLDPGILPDRRLCHGTEGEATMEKSTKHQPSTDAGMRVRLMLVDDHRIMRESLAGLLSKEPQIEIVAKASDGQEALELARQTRPDVVVMDVSMPGISGVEATRRIHDEFPDVRIIGLSMHEPDDLRDEMQNAGAAAYLTKDGPPDALLAAILAGR